MRITIKILAILFLLSGLAFTALGSYGLVSLESSIATLRMLQDGGMGMSRIDIPTFRIILYVTTILTLVLGVLWLVSGAGLFFEKNWARKLLIVTIILVVTWDTYSLVMRFINRVADFESLLGYVIGEIVLIAIIYFFLRKKTRVYFQVT